MRFFTDGGATLPAYLLLLAVASSGASAAPVTYDFTGTVNSVTYGGNGASFGAFNAITPGTAVAGTYTFNLANAVLSDSTLPVSTTSDWYALETSGIAYGVPTPNNAFVFSSTINVGGVPYSTSPVAGSYETITSVEGEPNGGLPVFTADATSWTSALVGTGAAFELYTTSGGAPLDAGGLPLFSASTTGLGNIQLDYGLGPDYANLSYSIGSLAPIPLPAAAWLMLSGLGALGGMTRKRKVA